MVSFGFGMGGHDDLLDDQGSGALVAFHVNEHGQVLSEEAVGSDAGGLAGPLAGVLGFPPEAVKDVFRGQFDTFCPFGLRGGDGGPDT